MVVVEMGGIVAVVCCWLYLKRDFLMGDGRVGRGWYEDGFICVLEGESVTYDEGWRLWVTVLKGDIYLWV